MFIIPTFPNWQFMLSIESFRQSVATRAPQITKLANFHSFLLIFCQQIAHEKKFELNETLGGIADRNTKKMFNNPSGKRINF